MKNSLKSSVKMFGVAGLVFLAGCGADTTVSNTVEDSVEIVEEVGQKTGETIEKTGDAMKEVGQDVVEQGQETMEQAGDAMTDGDKAGEAVNDELSFDMPYDSPAGPHTMPATLTIQDGLITKASTIAEADATNGAVKKWQSSFQESFSDAVVGKSLADLQDIEAIGGASLTTDGFKKAVAALNG